MMCGAPIINNTIQHIYNTHKNNSIYTYIGTIVLRVSRLHPAMAAVRGYVEKTARVLLLENINVWMCIKYNRVLGCRPVKR